jgi:hypothetical protein
MPVRQRRYPKEEFAQRGNAIYERDIRPQVEADNKGKYVAIDIETGAWEMDASETAAGDRLRSRVPDAQTWMMRIGYSYIRRFGAGRAGKNE